MTKIVNKIYNEGHFLTYMSPSVFITLPKKAGTTKCELHRTTSLMRHMTKGDTEDLVIANERQDKG